MDFMKLDIQLFSYYDGDVEIKVVADTKEFKKGLNDIQNTTKNAGGTVKNIVAGLGITKLITASMGQITNSIDGAISRYDTLNAFPNVMKNLGIATEDSQKAIDKMAEKLSGLPTTLDQGALAVQRFTSKNGDVKKSTDLFLALNNAILAGGADAQIQSTALEQLAQAYAKGKPDMVEWKSAMTAMPAQLKQVATAMGYVDAEALGEALRNGTVSMDEFMNTLVQLNEKGIDGFASFEEQARGSTGGIATSITVAKTQVVKGVTDIIEALDIKAEKLGIGKISDIIANLGKKAKEGLDMVAKVISSEMSVFDFGSSIGNMINNLLKKLNDGAPKIIETGMKLIQDFANGLISNLPTIIETATKLILTLVESLANNTDKVIDVAINLIMALADGLLNALPILIEKAPTIINKLITKLTSPEMISKLIQAGISLITQLAIGLVKAIPQVLKSVVSIKNALASGLNNLKSYLNPASIGKNIVKGLWEGISGAGSWFKNKISSWCKEVVSKFKEKLKIKSPSRVMRDEIGVYMAQGVGVGFTDELDSIYADMSKAIDFENAKLQSNVEMGKVFNTAYGTTPITIDLDASVEMDSQKVGRLVTPSVTRTIKNGGGI